MMRIVRSSTEACEGTLASSRSGSSFILGSNVPIALGGAGSISLSMKDRRWTDPHLREGTVDDACICGGGAG